MVKTITSLKSRLLSKKEHLLIPWALSFWTTQKCATGLWLNVVQRSRMIIRRTQLRMCMETVWWDMCRSLEMRSLTFLSGSKRLQNSLGSPQWLSTLRTLLSKIEKTKTYCYMERAAKFINLDLTFALLPTKLIHLLVQTTLRIILMRASILLSTWSRSFHSIRTSRFKPRVVCQTLWSTKI